MNNLSGAVAKTMNFVFSDIESATNDEKKKRIDSLKANIGKVANIPIEEIETSENVRKTLDTSCDSFLRLVESIKRYGILENVVVELRINKKENDYRLVCIAGHRRILAAIQAKTVARVPCLLQSYTQKGDGVGAALAENLNREDLHCLDVADGYRELLRAGWSEDELSRHFCRDIRTIRHYLKMGAWSDEIKAMFRDNPTVFSTRVIMRQFAYKKVSSDKELKGAIEGHLKLKKNKNPKVSRNIAKTLDKKNLQLALSAYLSRQNLLSQLIKDEIRKAFAELNLI